MITNADKRENMSWGKCFIPFCRISLKDKKEVGENKAQTEFVVIDDEGEAYQIA